MDGIDYSKIVPLRNSPEPLHIQLNRMLTVQIRALPPNRKIRLISERTLADLLDISRPTVHRAYAELLRSNLVSRKADKSLEICSDARSKITGTYRAIGVLIPMDFQHYIKANNYGAVPYLGGIIGRSAEKNISCIMLRPPGPEASAKELDGFINEHFPRLCGLIHLGGLFTEYPQDRAFETIIARTEIPQVCLSGNVDHPLTGSVCADPAPGITELCRELKKQKISTVGIICKKDAVTDRLFRYNAIERPDEFRKIIGRNGICCSEICEFPQDGFESCVRDYLLSPERPQAILCNNELIAEIVVDCAAENGIAVPEELAVIGYDCRSEKSALAGIECHVEKIAELAVDMLLEHFTDGVSDRNIYKTIPSKFRHGQTMRSCDSGRESIK